MYLSEGGTRDSALADQELLETLLDEGGGAGATVLSCTWHTPDWKAVPGVAGGSVLAVAVGAACGASPTPGCSSVKSESRHVFLRVARDGPHKPRAEPPRDEELRSRRGEVT
jgi:hypothetical protein